jgi:hypothetical protein
VPPEEDALCLGVQDPTNPSTPRDAVPASPKEDESGPTRAPLKMEVQMCHSVDRLPAKRSHMLGFVLEMAGAMHDSCLREDPTTV